MGDTNGRNTIALKPFRRRPWLYITEDPARRVALLRGDGAPDVIRAFTGLAATPDHRDRAAADVVIAAIPGSTVMPEHLAYAGFTATWSRSMRGYVIPFRFVPDVEAYCQNAHQLYVVSERKAKP